MIARVDKDWNARFEIEKPRLPRWCLTILAVPLLVASIPWAAFAIDTGFQDSMGNPRHSGLEGHIYIYCIALAPALVSVFLIYWDWHGRAPKNRTREND
jgi:hypothetical protein